MNPLNRAAFVFVSINHTDIGGGGYYARIFNDVSGELLHETDCQRESADAKRDAYDVCADENWGVSSIDEGDEDSCFGGSTFGPSVAEVERVERRERGAA